MDTLTGSVAAVEGWTAAQRSSLRSTAQERSSKLRAADYVERKDHVKRDGDVLVEAFNASSSMKVMGVNLRVQHENSMSRDKPSVTNLVSRTEVPP